MQLNHLQPNTRRPSKKRVARGGKRGKTAGRGTKGQKARAGHRMRPEVRDIIKKLPKLRGYGKNRARTVNDAVVKPAIINLEKLELVFSDGEKVSPETLHARGLIAKRGGRLPRVKILGSGALTKKLTVSACLISASAKRALEERGGKLEL